MLPCYAKEVTFGKPLGDLRTGLAAGELSVPRHPNLSGGKGGSCVGGCGRQGLQLSESELPNRAAENTQDARFLAFLQLSPVGTTALPCAAAPAPAPRGQKLLCWGPRPTHLISSCGC